MKTLRILFIIALYLAPLSALAGDQITSAVVASFDSLKEQIQDLEPDSNCVAVVRNLTIMRDRATILLKEGTLVLSSPLNGYRRIASFHGTGTYSMSFPDDVERQQYRRFMDKDTAIVPFTHLFLLFTDTTLQEILRSCTYSHRKVPGPITVIADLPLKLLVREPDILSLFLNPRPPAAFFAYFGIPTNEYHYFWKDPLALDEEIQFGREDNTMFHRYLEPINKYYALDSPRKEHPSFTITAIRSDATITGGMGFRAEADVFLRADRPNLRWICLWLYHELSVDSVWWGPLGRGGSVRPDDREEWFLLRAPEQLNQDTTYVVKLFYHGNVLNVANDEWVGLKSSILWLPLALDRSYISYDLTFHHPSRFTLISIGTKVSSSESDGVATSRWVPRSAVRNASFSMGLYDEYPIREQNLPPINVYISQVGHRRAQHMEENVGSDIAGSLSFFTRLFGRLDCDEFNVTEIPNPHGEAFAGIIHLAEDTFDWNNHKGGEEAFRAHEVAHQWWGIGVDFDTYHDQWLSEAFAEYSGLWYMQAMMKRNDEFFDLLDVYRASILKNRTFLFGSGQEAGPISLGYRTSSSETPGDYGLIIYGKGAWVLHMLRNMMLDLNSMNEQRFHALMKSYFIRYKGKRVTTQDFSSVVSEHFGKDMSWFFKEWVDDTRIPRYTFSYKTDPLPDGRFTVTCRILQEGVAEDFTMPIPLKIEFSEGRMARTRVTARGPKTEVVLPPLPLKPEKIEFNDLHSVLCTFDEVDWE